MKISVNLASKPFIELRPLFARLRIAMAGLVVLVTALSITLHMLSAKADTAQQKMAALKGREQKFENEQIGNETRMRQPQNAAVLARSEFLNDLFARKSFSWTAVMMDLEDVLPGGVQVTSIEPSIGTDGSVHIRLKVSGDRDRAVLLVRNLERSKRFLQPKLNDESMQASDQGQQRMMGGISGGVEFDILAGYNPLPEAHKDEEKKDSAAAGAKDGEKKTAAPASAKSAAKATNKTTASKSPGSKPAAKKAPAAGAATGPSGAGKAPAARPVAKKKAKPSPEVGGTR